jgi:hypothetical protein
LTTQEVFGEQYKFWSLIFRNFLHYPVTCSHSTYSGSKRNWRCIPRTSGDIFALHPPNPPPPHTHTLASCDKHCGPALTLAAASVVSAQKVVAESEGHHTNITQIK